MNKGVAAVGLCGLWLAGCGTTFTGSPHVENGRAGCEARCRSQGMEVAGIVYMGEYSDACVCSVPGRAGSRRDLLLASAAAATGGAAGVYLQMQQAQAQHSHR